MVKVSTLRIFFFLLGLLPAGSLMAQCPVTASCAPGNASSTNAPFINAGIYSVRFGNQPAITSAGYTEGYADKSCTDGVTLTQGNPDSLVINTGTVVDENVRVYVDWNNNGIFDVPVEQVLSSNGAKVHRGVINPPASAPLGQRLRLRIAADANLAALPGPCTRPEYSQTEDYFVLVQANTQPPVAGFTSADTLTCSGSVSFRDQSTGSPSTWSWTFGDGDRASTQNPIHIYSSPGRYTVTLIVSNANGSDTLVRSNFIYFNDTVPVAPTCRPITQQYCCNYGITRVTLRDEFGNSLINNTSANGIAGYEDFTCRVRARLIEGRPYSLALTTNPDQDQTTKVWIDFNNNGIFSDSTELVMVSQSARNPIDTLTFLAGPGGQLNKPLRMRIISDGGTSVADACTSPQLGQVEDYTIVLLQNTLPPVANFFRIAASGCDSVAQFVATPENSVSSFIWDFGDGNSDTTVTPAVTHEYQAHGVYTVSLVVVGPFGRDTLARNDLVNFLDSPGEATCAVPTIRAGGSVGIRRVRLADIDKSSGDAATEGYQDYTCEATTALKTNKSYPVSITTGPNNTEAVGIWIDWNNDLNFTPDEKVFASANRTNHAGILAAAPASAVQRTALRMRVVGRIPFQGGEPQACGGVDFGQAEDYTVVLVPNMDPPVARFGSPRSTCNGSISFTDSSENVVTSWLWRFGDGDTSTQRNPTHVYASPGTYTVTLVARNSFGVDSVVKADHITVFTNLNIADASCAPPTIQNCCGFGIRRVRLNTIDNQSADGSEGYQDFSCSNTTRLVKGSTYALRVNTNPQNRENLRAWIDWNSDGIFDAAEILGTSLSALDTHYITFTVPATGTEGRGLRLRILSDNSGNQSLDPCVSPNTGQIEDYSVVLDTNTTAPVAAFGAISRTSCNGYIQFRDSSANVPTAFRWDFGDNTFSTEQNPLKRYSAAGVYTVTLKVTNQFGADSTERTSYVTITGTEGVRQAACVPVRTAYCCAAGIVRVVYATVDNTSGNGAETDYQDFTCLTQAELLVGASYPVAIQLARGFNERVSGWIDWNDDSTFTNDEQVVFTPAFSNTNVIRDTIVVPANAVRGKPLRFRLVSAFHNGPGQGPDPVACGTYLNGQVEDYSVRVEARPPQANFGLVGNGACNGTVQFMDSTMNGATSWEWSFGDNQTSTLQNPLHQYAAAGTYTVQLIVSNPLGSDTITKANFVTVSGFRGPVAPVCYPASQLTAGIESGMTSVALSNITTGASGFVQLSGLSREGFRDFSCSDSLGVSIGDMVQVSVLATGANRNQFVSVMLDMNNDGNFIAEQVAGGVLQLGQPYQGRFQVPALTQGIRYRLRIIARAAGTAPQACNIQDGQAEDYALVVLPAGTAKAVQHTLSVFPNPASHSVKVRLPEGLNGRLTPEIVDGLGRVVLRHTATAGSDALLEVPVDRLPVGFYTLRLVSPNAIYTAPLSISR